MKNTQILINGETLVCFININLSILANKQEKYNGGFIINYNLILDKDKLQKKNIKKNK